ncbi:hypothetical protein HYX05_01155 [Candidatus Woesearchaeota archaeon]|nr:hypothetical protein [Candidatus Woesearchaeota archaeon]
MTLEDFMNDPEADAELRAGTKSRPKVTQEEHKRYVQDRLLEACGKLDLGSVEQQYQRAVSAVRELSIVPQAQDISDFCARNVALQPRILGIFASALVNTVRELEEPIILEIAKGVSLDYLGYRLSRGVVVKGGLGDHTAERMENGNLTVEGNCNGVVGEFQKGGNIRVNGSYRDSGAVRYGGSFASAGTNFENYYRLSNLNDIRIIISGEDDSILRELAKQIDRRQLLSLDPRMRRILKRKMVQIACEYNIELYEEERRSFSYQWLEQGSRESQLVKQWNKLVESQTEGRSAAGFGAGWGLTGVIVPQMFVVGGIYALFGIAKILHAGIKLDKMKPDLERLRTSISTLQGTIDSYNTKIAEARQFMYS